MMDALTVWDGGVGFAALADKQIPAASANTTEMASEMGFLLKSIRLPPKHG
jgi:hypothetical protein